MVCPCMVAVLVLWVLWWCAHWQNSAGASALHACTAISPQPNGSLLTARFYSAGGKDVVLGGQHVMWAKDVDEEELETNNMRLLDRHKRYRMYRLKDDTPLKVRHVLVGLHNVMQHGGRGRHSSKQKVFFFVQELTSPEGLSLSEAVKRMAYRSGYTTSEGTMNALVKRWNPVAKVLWHGGQAVVDHVMTLLTGKTDGLTTNFHAFKCIEGPQENELHEMFTAFLGDNVTSTQLKQHANKVKQKRSYSWHFQEGNTLIHLPQSMSFATPPLLMVLVLFLVYPPICLLRRTWGSGHTCAICCRRR